MTPRLLHLGLWLSVTLLVAGMAAASALLVSRMRDATLAVAADNLEQAARAAEAAVNRHLLKVDGTLAGLPALLRTAAGRGTVEQPLANALLRDLLLGMGVRDIVLVQPDGRVWASALAASRQAGLPMELHTLEELAGPASAPVVAGPVMNPATAEWSLFLVRRVSVPGPGQLIGAIEIPLQVLTGLLAPMGHAARVRIHLERADGQLLASVPPDETRIGTMAPRSDRFRADGAVFAVADAGGEPAALEVARLLFHRDIVVRVHRALPDVLAGWQRERNWIRIIVAGGVALLLCMALAMDMALRHRERMDRERARARRELENAIEAMTDGFVIWDPQDRLVACNRSFRELYAASADLLVPGARLEDVLRAGALRGQYPQCGADVEAFIRQVLAWRGSAEPVLERLLPDGRWLLVSERAMPDGGHVGIRTDITPLKHAMTDLAAATAQAEHATQEARIQSARLHAALENMSHGLCMVGPDARLIVCNRRFAAMFGLDEATIVPGTPFGQLCEAMLRNAAFPAPLIQQVRARQGDLEAQGAAADFLVEEADHALAVAHRPMPEGGWVATYEDASERMRAAARVRFLAHHDPLTELPNRVLFRERLDEALGRLTDEPGRGREHVALLCLDLDRFKQVNDTLGHAAGDALLVAAARRLRRCVRGSDVVARLGGDEFAVIHRAAHPRGSAEAIAQRIIDTLGAPYDIQGRQVVVGVSIGITSEAHGPADAETLLKHADVALYRAKSVGRGTFCWYDKAMSNGALRRVDLEADLREALSREQVRLVYQPVLDLGSGRLHGFEALVRWSHPGLGQVAPAEFIPIAEETGLILRLGEAILEMACAAAATWPDPIRLAVNLSPMQLCSPGLPGIVARAIARAGIDPGRMELEITETALLQESEDALAVLQDLRGVGIRIALDDFGTGFSSLRHLTSLPVDLIKIDRSFVSKMVTRADCRAIVSSVASLARQLGLATTAEGVETEEQLRLVAAAGCTAAQGFLIGKPVPVGDTAALTRRDAAWMARGCALRG
jgi:diguanylate cyclase (GGDEF)-like protein